jgi:hypothetical protein
MTAWLKSWWAVLTAEWRVPVQPKQIQILRIESQKITMAQWRSQQASVGASMELANHPIYRAQRDILESQHPRHVMLKMGSSETDRLVHQARTEGYELALWNMDSLAIPLKEKKEIEATFEPPEQQEK